MKMKFNFIFILLILIIFVASKEEEKSKKKKLTTEITITTTTHEHEDENGGLDTEDEDEPHPKHETKEEYEEEPIIKEERKTNRKNGTESETKTKRQEKTKEKEIKEDIKREEEVKKEQKRVTKKEKEEDIELEEEEEDEVDESERKSKSDEEKEKNKDGKEEKESTEEDSGKGIRRERKDSKSIPSSKKLILTAPYQDNEDFMVTPLGLGTPVNFVPLQVDTTSYKSWVASATIKENPSTFSYDKKGSKTYQEPGEWDTVVDEEGTISGNVIYDKANFGKFEINKFKFIEAVEYEDDFNDYQYGKLGLGNCEYADENEVEFCLLDRLKDNGSIERRIFSIREDSDTHGEIVIGDVTSDSRENDYPLLPLISKDEYEDIEDDEFKMGWLTKVSHVIFKNDTSESTKGIFKNNIYSKDGLASFDSSSHYIEAPYSYINEFQEKMFDKYYPNACRRVNSDGTYMFLCNKEKYEEYQKFNKDLSFIIVMDGNGFKIPMDFLFEQIRENDYEFFVHFKDYEQNIWNLGHPFFHHYTIIFDQDNQEIGIDGKNIYDLKDATEGALKSIGGWRWWKILLLVLLLLLALVGVCYILRYYGIKYKLDNGVSPSLVDNESVDDLSFAPGQNVH